MVKIYFFNTSILHFEIQLSLVISLLRCWNSMLLDLVSSKDQTFTYWSPVFSWVKHFPWVQLTRLQNAFHSKYRGMQLIALGSGGTRQELAVILGESWLDLLVQYSHAEMLCCLDSRAGKGSGTGSEWSIKSTVRSPAKCARCPTCVPAMTSPLPPDQTCDCIFASCSTTLP